jgi:hypothetical protein
MNAKPADRETVTFDYGIPAELFMGKRKGGARQPLRYRRFATAAEAIRFAIETTSNAFTRATITHCNGVRRINCERAVGQFDCGGGFPRF